MENTTRLINVDLDLRCASGLRPLVHVLKPEVIAVQLEDHWACLELAEQPRTVEEAMIGFAELIEKLPLAPREGWERCEVRSLNVGIQASTQPYSSLFTISAPTVRRLADLGAEVAFTVYAPELTARSG